MKVLHRIIDKWTIALTILVCFFTSVIFYQFNKNMEYEERKVSAQDVYFYYNQMLNDYYDNLRTKDDKQARFWARAKVYMIHNMEQWSRLKEEDEATYDAENYDKKIQVYQESAPEVYDYYQELKETNSMLLNDYIVKSDAINMALKLYDDSFDYIDGYSKMIDNYILQGDSMLLTDIYADSSTFAHTNILKSKYDFRKLKDLSIKPDNSYALEKVASASAFLNIFVLFIVLVCVFRFFDDRKNGLIYVIYSSKSGRGILAAKRIAALAVVSVVSTSIVYIFQFMIAFHIYGGFEFMGNPLQSHQKYATICFTSNKWIFVLVLLLLSAAAVFMTGLAVWILVGLFHNITVGMGITVIILGISYVLYIAIPEKSMWVFLKTINIWNIILPINTVGRYANAGFGTFILDKVSVMGMMDAIAVAVFSIVCITEGCCMKPVRKSTFLDKMSDQIKKVSQRVVAGCPLLLMELYKLFWVHRGLFVVGIIFLIVCNSGIRKGYSYDADMLVAMNYYKEAEGMPLSDELMQIVSKYETEKEYWDNRVNEISISIANNSGDFSRDDLREALIQEGLYKEGVEEIHRNIDNLNKLQEKGMKGVVTSPFAVEEMFGSKLFDHQKMYGFLSVIGLIFLLFGILSEERRHNMMKLIHTSQNGRGRWFAVKAGTVLIATTLIWAVVFVPNVMNVAKTYDILGINVLVQDYPLLSYVPIEISLKGYIICTMVWKLIILMAIAGIILLISSVFDYLISLIVSLALVFTHILHLLGFEALYYLSIVSPLLISENQYRSGNQMSGVIVLVLGIVCWGITLYREVFRR